MIGGGRITELLASTGREKNMACFHRKNCIVDENIAEGDTCAWSRRSSEPNGVEESPRTALVLTGSQKRFIVFQVLTRGVGACRRFLSPPLLVDEYDGKRCVGNGDRGNLDRQVRASPTTSVLYKVDVQKKWMIHMLEEVISAKGFITRSLLWEDATSHCHWKNNSSKRRKNILGSLGLASDTSNSSTLPGSNLTTSKPKGRNSTKKTRKKVNQNRWSLHGKDHSDSAEGSPTVSASEPASLEKLTSSAMSSTGATGRSSSEYGGTEAPEVIICSQPAIGRYSTKLCDISMAEKTSETAISTSSKSIFNLNKIYFSVSTQALTVDQVLDHGNGGSAACSGVNDATGNAYSRREDEAASSSQKSTAPQSVPSRSSIKNLNNRHVLDVDDLCRSEDPVLAHGAQVSSRYGSSAAADASPSVKRDRSSRKAAASSGAVPRPSKSGEYRRTRKEVNHAVWKRVQRNGPHEETVHESKETDSNCMGKRVVASDPVTSGTDLARISTKFGGKSMSISPEKSTPRQAHRHSSKNGSHSRKGSTEKSTPPPLESNSVCEVGCVSVPDAYPQVSDDIISSQSSVLPVRERAAADEVLHRIGNDISEFSDTLNSPDMKYPPLEEMHFPSQETSGWRPEAVGPSKARITDSLTFDRSTTVGSSAGAGDQGKSSSETDLDGIVHAVEEGRRLGIASEALHPTAGSPLTGFERFLHSAAPDLGQLSAVDVHEPGDERVSQRQIPDVPLRRLWQWYERPGNYGLEVKVDGRPMNPPRSDGDRSNFRAYFVPYLSAVQLFGRSSGGGSLQVGPPPTFSVLLPSPRKEATDPAVDSCELLFEYFESDPPQLRPPLYQKIKELVGGGGSSSDPRMSGDPAKLERLNLHDLHCGSWFSVAWYPIYRIPDGGLRAAFLTFHSLGVFARRTASREVISPVVGLLSYNAKGEGWFRGVTGERLTALERTASLITRSTVPGGGSGGNRHHPDYEFFSGRR